MFLNFKGLDPNFPIGELFCEMMQTASSYHDQYRLDSDQYITIDWNNIHENKCISKVS